MRLIRLIGRIGLIGLICLIGLSGCKNWRTITVEKPVYVHDTTYVNHTDSIVTVDSVIVECETIVREADSATLAEYGLKIKEGERIVLVLRRELERQKKLAEIKTTDTVNRYIEVPVPVTKYVPVERELTKWKKILMWMGVIGLAASVVWVLRKLRVIKKNNI